MKKQLIIGLGNLGEQYELTRHNLGFMFLDFLVQQLELNSFSQKNKLQAQISVNSSLILIKPQTFMNKSGNAVLSSFLYFSGNEYSAEELIVVHDDLDLEFGKFKIQKGIGPKQHNGLISIYHCLQTSLFWHVRIGIDDRSGDRSIPSDRYVLQNLSTDQQKGFNGVFKEALDELILLKLIS